MADDLETLVRRWTSGDRSVEQAMTAQLQRMAWGVARNWQRPHYAPEDLVQDILHHILRYLGSWRGEACFSTWFYVVAQRICSRLFNPNEKNYGPRNQGQANTHPESSLMELADQSRYENDDSHASAEEAALKNCDHGALQEVVTQLPLHQREVIVLRYGHDMSFVQIALTLGIPEGTVKTRHTAALRNLRRTLIEQYGFGGKLQ